MELPESSSMRGRQKRWRGQAGAIGQCLLPGLPNDLTLQMIVPKLPWSAFHTLSSVSGAWRRAIRTRVIYDARVGCRSTETLVCFGFRHPPSHLCGIDGIALYSMRDGSCSELPPIPGTSSGVPKKCQTISLDGKMYVLGGDADDPASRGTGSDEVYVCDLAGQGQKQWKRCASMKQGRREFGCGVSNGKIYVFGGLTNFHPISESEVYDPKEDSWSFVKPMANPRFGHVVETVGEELVMIGGYFPHNLNPLNPRLRGIPRFTHARRAKFTEVYHPAENEWRVGKFVGKGCVGGCTTRCGRKCMKKLFMARGELYSMGLNYIHIRNAEEDAWTLLHTFSVMSSSCNIVERWDVQVVDDELVIRVFWMDNVNCFRGYSLAQSKGFGREKRELVWEKFSLSLPFANMNTTNGRVCTIQL